MNAHLALKRRSVPACTESSAGGSSTAPASREPLLRELPLKQLWRLSEAPVHAPAKPATVSSGIHHNSASWPAGCKRRTIRRFLRRECDDAIFQD